MTAKKNLQYTGSAPGTFYTGGREWSVDPGEVISGDRPDRDDLLASGWFKEVTKKPPKAASKAPAGHSNSGTGGAGAGESKGGE